MRYFIAGPHYNEDEVKILKGFEEELNNRSTKYYSISEFNELEDSTESLKLQLEFDEVIKQISESTNMIAVVNKFDMSTAFLIGCFLGYRKLLDADIGRYLLLFGDLKDVKSDRIKNAIGIFKTIISSGVKFIVLDLNEEIIINYVILGLCYSYGISVVSWLHPKSGVTLNPLIIKATTYDYVYSDDKNSEFHLSKEALMYELLTDFDSKLMYLKDLTDRFVQV